jgi:DNA-binding NarL/FixJ family response regulator
MLNVLIADDHAIVIHGLKDLLQNEFGEVNVGEATSKEEILGLINERQWDLIMLDIIIPEMNIIEMVTTIRQKDANVPILILTVISEVEYSVRTLAAGANGYVTKHEAADDLVKAVHQVLSGETYLNSEAVSAMAAQLHDKHRTATHDTLSKREMEVFCLIAQGKAVKEIAYELSVSAKTVSTYIVRIRDKTGLANYVDIARYALQNRLVD